MTFSKATASFLASLGIKGDSLMDWTACSSDLNHIEDYWSFLKQQIYADGYLFSPKAELWKALKDAAASVPPAQIKKRQWRQIVEFTLISCFFYLSLIKFISILPILI